jgi:hypothetical protein
MATTTKSTAESARAKDEHEHTPKDVQTTLNYYLEPSAGGTTTIYPGTVGDKLRKFKPSSVTIHDMRLTGADEQGIAFALDTHGFQLLPHIATETAFRDDDTIESKYYPEVVALLKRVTGATRVHIFSHVVRRVSTDEMLRAVAGKPETEMMTQVNPARYVHIDQSYDGALQILRRSQAAEADTLAKTRWGIVNVWRPIGRRVTREPLAVCDVRSVAEADLRRVVSKLRSPKEPNPYNRGKVEDHTNGVDGAGTVFEPQVTQPGFEIWNIAANPEHRWWYASGMDPEEVLLIKCFDSRKDGTARRAPHSAFATDEDYGPARESIEARCLVFWENESSEGTHEG